MKRKPFFRLLLILGISVLACETSVPTSRPLPPASPASGTEPLATPENAGTQAPATSPQPSSASILVQGVDNRLLVFGTDGQSTPFVQANQPFNSPIFTFNPGNRVEGNSLFALSSGQSGLTQAFTATPQEVKALEFIKQVSQGLAVFAGNGSQPVRLAWDAYTIDQNNNAVSSSLFTSGADGSNLKEAVKETGSQRVLVAGRWSKDGQKIFFSKEPLGLGGYILFGGSSNLWAHNIIDGATNEVLKDAGVGCIDDLSPDESMVAHHCNPPNIGVTQVSSGVMATINPPAQLAEAKFSGSVRFSPDGKRVAFGLARGNPENEQGWVAVSDGLTGISKLIATSPQGQYFQVAVWLDNNMLLLQSWGATPGIWVVQADGSGLNRIADGVFHGLISAGQ